MIYFDTLKERVQQCWITIHEVVDPDGNVFYVPHASIWTSYRRMYEEGWMSFYINEIRIKNEWNTIVIDACNDDWRSESFETKLYFKPSWGIRTEDFEYTEAMESVKRFGVSIDS